jgi:hypothetical protein
MFIRSLYDDRKKLVWWSCEACMMIVRSLKEYCKKFKVCLSEVKRKSVSSFSQILWIPTCQNVSLKLTRTRGKQFDAETFSIFAETSQLSQIFKDSTWTSDYFPIKLLSLTSLVPAKQNSPIFHKLNQQFYPDKPAG